MTALASCHDIPFFTGYKQVDKHVWDSRDTLVFDIPQTEKDMLANLSVGLRTTGIFMYSKMSVVAIQKDSNSVVVAKDTLNIALFTKEGKPLKQGFPYVDTQVKSDKPLVLRGGMKYTVELTHIMKLSQIEGVYDVGVILN